MSINITTQEFMLLDLATMIAIIAVMCSHRLALGIMNSVHTVVVLFVYLRMSWFGQELSPMGVHNIV